MKWFRKKRPVQKPSEPETVLASDIVVGDVVSFWGPPDKVRWKVVRLKAYPTHLEITSAYPDGTSPLSLHLLQYGEVVWRHRRK